MDRNYIVELIKANRLQEALKAIEKASQGSHLHNQAIILSASYAEYAQLNRTAAQDFQTLEMQRAKITNSLLSFLDELSPDDLEKVSLTPKHVEYTPPSSTISFNKNYLYIGGGLLLLLILYFAFSGSEPKEVTDSNLTNTELQTGVSGHDNNSTTHLESQVVNGENVKLVEYSQNGNVTGTFIQKGSSWVEATADNPSKFKFKEEARDEWSVYLRDDARGVDIQLDLYAKEVKYSKDKGTVFVLSKIIHAE